MNGWDHWCEIGPLGDMLVRGAQLAPERNAIVFPTQKRTYSQLLAGARKVARGLIALGVKPGEKVGMLMINGPEFVEGLFGITLMGCIAVPLNARHKSKELRFIIENAELVSILTTYEESEYQNFTQLLCDALPSLAASANPVALDLPEAPRLKSAVLLLGKNRPGFLDRATLDALAATKSDDDVEALRLRVRVRDTALIIYTSGTTANPKGCMLSHEATVRGPTDRARRRFATGGANVHWGGGPLFHIGSLAPFIGTIGVVGTHLTDTYFDAGRALALMYEHKATTAWPWFAAIMQALLDHPTFDAAKLGTLKTLLLIGPEALMHRVLAALPQTELLQACGMTETAGIFAITGPEETIKQRATTQGHPSPGIEVRIRDLEGNGEAPRGKVGELMVRGYCVMDGYYHDPKKTAEALDEDGWLYTGDLYSREADGCLIFNGRLKDMLKVGGENVAAIEVEAFLCQHPAVKWAEVVGLPDPRLDEVPAAFVELRAGEQLEAEALIEFCKGKIASYKVPRQVHFLKAEDWPMSATKVDKRALRTRLAELQPR